MSGLLLGYGVNWRAAAARKGIRPGVHGRPSVMVAQLLAVHGEGRAAESACREIVQYDPDNLPALRWLASALEAEGRFGEAAECRRRIFEIEARASGFAANAAGEVAAFRLAVEGYGPQPPRVPQSYLTRKFDDSADEFDFLLREKLLYRGPELVHSAVLRALRNRRPILDILDAGCGTGLAAPLFRPLARRLDGVDLSFHMVEKARARGLYDKLEVGDLVETLARRSGAYDLVLAVDVLIYIGDISGVMTAVATGLRRGGLFSFSVEAGEESKYALRRTGRYVHSPVYLREAAAAAGLGEVSLEQGVLRLENLRPVTGWIAVVCKGTTA